MSGAFRRRNARAMYEQHHGPNMTPMVDVVMVILIFFMASAALLGPEWFLRTSLARAGPSAPAPAAEPRRLLVRMAPGDGTGTTVEVSDGRASVAADIDFAALEGLLGAEVARTGRTNLVVLIAPDAAVPYADVVRVHETCARLGIVQVGLAER